MQVLASVVVVVVVVCAFVAGAPMDSEGRQAEVGAAPALALDGGAEKRQEKRGIGLATYSGLTGFGYDTGSLGLTGYPAATTAYITPTVIKSTYTVPAATATYHQAATYDAAHGKYAYGGFYPASYGSLGTAGYTAFAPAATYTKIVHPASYSKIIHPPATSTYTKVIQTYPSATLGVVAPATVSGYGGVPASIGGYVY
ncbi:uncharacterized protein LOC126569925 [Anopheles aquasalis]|uniref:uncharacterized protein LOC126569925 n=1 Tax=Anopheles aquasalis TaxID=42839 RepID=UPI00215B456C|nr:uncharacterized protein LOC126569925 [Anopheles aquasalis]